MANRAYRQYCGLAHALDMVGDRWTLLIVRELMAGPRRYSDLADGLAGVPTNVLADRLERMQADGLLRRRRLDPPASSVSVYELTDFGEGLVKPVVELARWGLQTLKPARGDRAFRTHWLVLALQATFEAEEAAGVSESYEFRLGEDVITFQVADGEGSARVGAGSDPAVVVTTDADTFLAYSGGGITVEQVIERGATIEGDPAAIGRLTRILPPSHVPSEEPVE